MRKGYIFLSVLLFFIVSFIAINFFLYFKIKDLREEKRINSMLIEQSSKIEKDSYVQLVNIDDYSVEQIKETIRIFELNALQLQKNKYLDSLNLRLEQLNSYSRKPAHYVQPKLIKVLYANINNESRRSIKSLRKLNRQTDDALNLYFSYNFATMFIACILGGVVVLLTFFQMKTNRAYFKVSKIHNLLLENSIDFVMISDKNKKIIEFNKASQNAFGYTLEEVQKLGKESLFYDKSESVIVSKAIEEKGYFKGEIMNRRKNGESFSVYLSANVILDKKGNRIGTMGVSRDISQEKLDQQKQECQTREIQKSIDYASGLQSATLPSNDNISSIFPDYFLMYRPKDTLSGDFYLTEKVNQEGVEFAYLVIADCTGHGIPGANLCTYCNGLVKSSFKDKTIQTPGQILDYARTGIAQFFNSNKTNTINDGMDAAVCKFDLKNNILHFSGANCCCYVIRKGELIKLTSTKQSVSFSDNPKPFVDHTLQLEANDAVYLATDGYMDQFGGPNNKKYMKKQLTMLLLSISHFPISEQGKIIQEEFESWKVDQDQTDDVLFFALRV